MPKGLQKFKRNEYRGKSFTGHTACAEAFGPFFGTNVHSQSPFALAGPFVKLRSLKETIPVAEPCVE